MSNEVKTMLVLYVPSDKDSSFAHHQMVTGGFDINRPIEAACALNGAGIPDDSAGMFFMQEVRSQA